MEKLDKKIEEDASKITEEKEIKHRPKWLRGLIFIYNKCLYACLHVVTYFTNRGIFALKAFCTFNLILIGFVIAEWWLYQYTLSELIPKLFQDFKSNYFQ